MSRQDSTRFYVYVHRRKDNNAIFYVGKGSGRRAYSKQDRNKHWRNIALGVGFDVELVLDCVTEREAHCHEIFLIGGLLACGVKLANYTLGGEGFAGCRHTKATKERMSKARKGVALTTSARDAIFAGTTSEQAKAKKSASLLLYYSKPENLERLRAIRSEQNRRPEVLAKNSAGVSRARRERGYVAPVECITTGQVFECLVDAAAWIAGVVSKNPKTTRTAIVNAMKRGGSAYGMRWRRL